MAELKTDETPAANRPAGSMLLALLGCLLGTYLASTFVLPWKLLTLPFAVAGLVFAVMALRRTTAAKTPMLLPVAATAGLLGCVFFAGIVVAQAIFWDSTADYEQCMAEALTDRAGHECSNQYNEHLGVVSE